MFSISRNSLPTIQTYQQACEFWINAKPQDAPYRALNPNNKRDTSKRVWSPDEGKTICFRFHRTDLVEYAEDRITIRGWNSVSSAIFINELTPYGISAHGSSHNSEFRVNNMRPGADGVVFRRLAVHLYEVDPKTVLPDYQIVVDRKIVARASKALRPFFKYRAARAVLTGQRRPTGNLPPMQWLRDYIVAHHADETRFCDLYERVAVISNQVIHRELVAYWGGVSRIKLPLGQIPTKSVYDVLAPL